MPQLTWQNRITRYGEESPDQLLAHPLNFRTHPKSQQDALSGVLGEVGVVQNVIVNERTGHVVDGHLRISLAMRENQTTIPVTYVDLSPEEEALILATLDPISAMAGADRDKLDELLRDVSTSDAAVMEMLSDLAESAGVVGFGTTEGLTDPDEVPDPPAEPITQPGDLWLLGRHRLLCGDSTKAEDVARLMAGEKAACVFTSPPYAVGVDYGETYQDTIDDLRVLLRAVVPMWPNVIASGGFAVVNFGDVASGKHIAETDEPCEYPMALEYWPIFRDAGYVLWSRRIWCKPNPRVHSLQCIGSNRAATDWEHIWTWKVPGRARIERVDGEMRSALGWIDTTRQEGVEVGKDTHGAGMATSIASHMLAVHSNLGEIVFDPFGGTGTTLIAAGQIGRVCYLTEINPSYCDIILRRWEQFTGQTATRAAEAMAAD
jgi:DNA modification methylase